MTHAPASSTPISSRESTPTNAPAAPGEATRNGRPIGMTEHAVNLLRSVIRTTGVSDSAAAVRMGISTSALSRWKQRCPELRVALLQAREECRATQLDLILQAAQGDPKSGWRAAAWLLERLHPEDYHPRAEERAKFQHLQARELALQEREDRLAKREEALAASESDSQNSRNPLSEEASPAPAAPAETAPAPAHNPDSAAPHAAPASPAAPPPPHTIAPTPQFVRESPTTAFSPPAQSAA